MQFNVQTQAQATQAVVAGASAPAAARQPGDANLKDRGPKPLEYPGWRVAWSDKYVRWYWWNVNTMATTWEAPIWVDQKGTWEAPKSVR
jgi:hypothetical protein